MNFADTNWVEAVYMEPAEGDEEAVKRRAVVERFLRKHGGQLALSHIVLLEARNVFSRVTREKMPREWSDLEADFDAKLYVDPMNWHMLRRECDALLSRYAWKEFIGTFDVAIIASAKLAGATCFLSFDVMAKALASAEGLDVFPPLDAEGKRLRARLKR